MFNWNNFWKRDGFLTHLVKLGRIYYHYHFKKIIKEYINQTTDLLEIGCGTSTLTLGLCDEINSLVGVDISQEAIKISKASAHKRNIKNAKFIKANCFNLKLKPNQFDIVWSQGLIEHFNNPIKIIKEHLKVCKDDGLVIISVPYLFSYVYVWHLVTRIKPLRRFFPWGTQTFYTKARLSKLIDKLKLNYNLYLAKPLILGDIILEIKK